MCVINFQVAQSDAPTLYAKFRDWSASNWNWLDAIAIILFYVGLILRVIHTKTHVGHVVYAIDCYLWWIRLLDVCFAHRVLGPYVVMVFRMVGLLRF